MSGTNGTPTDFLLANLRLPLELFWHYLVLPVTSGFDWLYLAGPEAWAFWFFLGSTLTAVGLLVSSPRHATTRGLYPAAALLSVIGSIAIKAEWTSGWIFCAIAVLGWFGAMFVAPKIAWPWIIQLVFTGAAICSFYTASEEVTVLLVAVAYYGLFAAVVATLFHLLRLAPSPGALAPLKARRMLHIRRDVSRSKRVD